VDERIIEIQGVKYKAIFDTGASESMICSGALEGLEDVKVKPTVKEYSYFDGGTNKTCGVVELKFVHKNKTYIENFNVVDVPLKKNILIANTMVKSISEVKKPIPIKCSINTGNSAPVNWTRPIRSQKDREEFAELLKELESKGIVEPSQSTWLNPVVITRKRDGKILFCIDFRRLNDLVQLDGFEVPRIYEILAALHDKRYFSTIDLKDGFYHVDLNEQDREKTTFFTGSRLMQIFKMPQGFRNSPAVFQRAMTLMFKDVIGVKCFIYIDDILVFGKTKEEHDDNLAEILSIMNCYGLKENVDKRVTCKKRYHSLGTKYK
jgi:hypothetical protein